MICYFLRNKFLLVMTFVLPDKCIIDNALQASVEEAFKISL